jgi:hypothetical protein
MTRDEVAENFEELLQAHAPGMRALPITRGVDPSTVDAIYHIVLAASGLGVFSGLWKVFQLFFLRYTSCRVKIAYESRDGARVEQEFTRLSQVDALKIAEAHPPSGHVLVQVFER